MHRARSYTGFIFVLIQDSYASDADVRRSIANRKVRFIGTKMSLIRIYFLLDIKLLQYEFSIMPNIELIYSKLP